MLSVLVPAMIVDVLDTGGRASGDTDSLQFCFYGGSPAPEPVLEEFQSAFGVDSLIDYYGLTEVDVLAFADGRDDLADYETPRRVFFVDAFPRTGSQKIDKVALADELEERIV